MPTFTIRRKKNPQKLNVFFLDQNRRNYRLYGTNMTFFIGYINNAVKKRMGNIIFVIFYPSLLLGIIFFFENNVAHVLKLDKNYGFHELFLKHLSVFISSILTFCQTFPLLIYFIWLVQCKKKNHYCI